MTTNRLATAIENLRQATEALRTATEKLAAR